MGKSPTQVLVVDDEEDLELLVRQKFRRRIREGHLRFLFAHNGKEALEVLQECPDVYLVLSDINMPVMDGLTLLGQLADGEKDIQAVIVSAYGDMRNIRTAMNRGAFDFLTKPIDFNDLEATIEKGLKHVQALQRALETRDRLVAVNQELDMARDVQMSFQPDALPANEHHDVKAVIIPAREVGGDLYDFFFIDTSHLGLVIADVSGKGVPAALFTTVTRALLRATASKDFSTPGECLTMVNDLLCENNPSCTFITLFFGVLDLRTGELSYSNAGHNPPRVLRAGSGVDVVPKTGNLVLGIQQEHKYHNGQIQLAPGDTLFLYTDGITEAEDSKSAEFSESRLDERLAELSGASSERVLTDVVDAVQEFVGDAVQSDDITCLAARFLAPLSVHPS
ncbi:MAG: SpoIIE family protein phosphatase [Nitrospira sp. SB0677_bin_15]|nr:SpoIIE family protein phosphatase [Nitrospira sp. SB0667_bin_9]MYD32169.1 SpoIIE family protein phosphatase [Nitrospira sp. SB0661_bin_20]MYG41364.1 SpoIIE family protein phosphatase [Nitrospira sp. SB0677_bin_15]MYH02148.1 SpoIIE family protein phosphatase [Nitrospira sp. SB0675_bin_23]MYJ23287.1 SpoIIE family protein phosphatase [Nitrospira sp. SB0673_bin_12]